MVPALVWIRGHGRVVASRIRVVPAGVLRKELPLGRWVGRALEVRLRGESGWRQVGVGSVRLVSAKNKERLLRRAKELRALYWSWEAKDRRYGRKARLFDELIVRIERIKT